MRIVALALLSFAATSAHAQVAPPAPPPSARPPVPANDWTLSIGMAPVLSPAWQGSNEMALSIFPDIRLNYRDILFASAIDGFGWNAINENGWRAGPLARVRFGRNEDNGGSPFLITGGSDALVGMGNVQTAGEVGGFVEKSFGPKREWRVRGELRQGFGGHEGVVFDASASYRTRIGRAIANIGPRATITSQDFMQTYFGIDAGQSARTGYARYEASGGLLSYGVGGSLIRPLTRRTALTMFTNLERLGDEAADSPLVRERGQRTQFTLGLGYGYRFGL
ncbi:MipA/OmpV family protein [Sphingomonas sp. 37zxx]|uniref:MipA/OmpV family protein n=1 Tax=Sphingomonas sp. 37zxx TaxID=1550073 RepID=UPI0009DDE5F9|nr:MipA/OmpV family protein [Sphingomonas sp. 37zxx]